MNLCLGPKTVVYDSGIGGESCYRQCKKVFVNCFYFSDRKNFPYGKKQFKELKAIFLQNLDLLNLKEGDLLILACHTVSCVYLKIKHSLNLAFTVITILESMLELSDGMILCTGYTSSYLYELGRENQSLIELAELIEYKKTEKIKSYLKSKNIQQNTLIYGCTHYPIVDNIFKVIYDKKTFINPESMMMRKIERWIEG